MAKVCISHFDFNQVIVNVQRTCVWVKQIRHLNTIKQTKTKQNRKKQKNQSQNQNATIST